MLTERLNELLKRIDATGAEIAKKVGFDRTNISRIKSGKRVPHPDSATAEKLINGIYLFSDNKNNLKKLCSVVGANPKASAKEIKQAIKEWLYEGYDYKAAENTDSRAKKKREEKANASHYFGERLNSSMLLAELSNVRLSKLVHADASLISRYRSGVRTPVSNSELANQISSVLFDRIIRSGKESELCDLMRIHVSELEDETFTLWLYGTDEQEDNVQVAENILGIFDSLPSKGSMQFPDVSGLVAVEYDNQSVYYGTEGLRSAVLRFLSTAIKENVDRLCLYSDMNQSWMTQDREFLVKWASLMSSLVKNKTHINIIHNIDRSLDEMSDAIRSWLPLYMSGMIESYSCRKQRNPRFSHTMFLIPGVACIRAFQVAASESDVICHFYTDPKSLELCEREYNDLLKSCFPLIHPLSKELFPLVSDVIIIKNTLSFATMSDELARSFNDRSLYENWQVSNSLLLKKLETNTVYECIPLAGEDTLTQGKVPVAKAYGDSKYFYTPEQYSMHIRSIIALSEKYDSYRFYPIPETPFSNIDLLISDSTTKITPAFRPGLSFALNQPSMCAAFKAYAKTLMEKNKTDRNSLRKMLEAKCLCSVK
jgi:transcriptional regulator with XRE-family HTH domain